MAKTVSSAHPPVVDVKVRAAHRGALDADDRVAVGTQCALGSLRDANVAGPLEDHRLHDSLLLDVGDRAVATTVTGGSADDREERSELRGDVSGCSSAYPTVCGRVRCR